MTRLPPLDLALCKHYLTRQQRLHGPGVYRLFCTSAVEARAKRSDPSTGEYLGLTRQLQGHWDKDFLFVQIASPLFGVSNSAGNNSNSGVVGNTDSSTTPVSAQPPSPSTEELQLREVLSAVNKLRPKFLVLIGNLTYTAADDTGAGQHALFDLQVESARRTMARLADTIPAIYVPGCNDVGLCPTPHTLLAYRKRFGADYFGFWYGGMRGIVINSTLMIHSSGALEEANRQNLWLTEEIEQCKLCSNSIVIFSYHPWFLHDIDEDDEGDVVVAENKVEVRAQGDAGLVLNKESIRYAKIYANNILFPWMY